MHRLPRMRSLVLAVRRHRESGRSPATMTASGAPSAAASCPLCFPREHGDSRPPSRLSRRDRSHRIDSRRHRARRTRAKGSRVFSRASSKSPSPEPRSHGAVWHASSAWSAMDRRKPARRACRLRSGARGQTPGAVRGVRVKEGQQVTSSISPSAARSVRLSGIGRASWATPPGPARRIRRAGDSFANRASSSGDTGGTITRAPVTP